MCIGTISMLPDVSRVPEVSALESSAVNIPKIGKDGQCLPMPLTGCLLAGSIHALVPFVAYFKASYLVIFEFVCQVH